MPDSGNSRTRTDDSIIVTCDRMREAISALGDGEDPGMAPELVERHLTRCTACRSYGDDLAALRRATTVRAAPSMPDLAPQVVKLDRIADRLGRWGVVRGVLAIAAIEIVVLSVPALVLGEESATSAHAARHLGAFTVAYGVALLVVCVRPARARTVLPVAAVLAVALLVTAVIDVVEGRVPLAGEALHVPELISVVLVWLLTVRPAGRSATPDAAAGGRPPLGVVRPHGAEDDRRAL